MLAVGLAVSLTGCGESDRPKAKESRPSGGRGSVGSGLPAYNGPVLPGLEPRPVAHLQGLSYPVAVGDAFANIQTKLGSGGLDESTTVDFYDAATGHKRVSVNAPFKAEPSWQVGNLNGAAAVFLHGVKQSASDGLNQPTRRTHQIGFDTSGRKLVDTSWKEDDLRDAVTGWSATHTRGLISRNDLTIYAPDGTPRLRLPADPGHVMSRPPEVHTIIDGVAVIKRRARRDGGGLTEFFAAYDLAATGRPVWRSDMIRPRGSTGDLPNVAFVSGDRLGMVWPAGPRQVLVAVHDLRSGAVVATSQPIAKNVRIDPGSEIVKAVGTPSDVAVLRLGPASTNLGSAAMRISTGQLLWQQPAAQEGFTPALIIGGAVYGDTHKTAPPLAPGGRKPPTLALGVADGKILARELPTAPVAVTDHGYALVPDIHKQGAFWIFRAAKG
ncbi:hypothetical protein GCM10010411_20470 [Actinomadura fulvescens]|uniref:Lipoprotein n=2 Tax=Actinomadura fulvescens TaxID=46160 RepID=A0ABN3PLC6_9ACTN